MIRNGRIRCSLLSILSKPKLNRSFSQDSNEWLQRYKNTLTVPNETHEIGKLSPEHLGQKVVLHGYLGPGKRRDISQKLSFWDITSRQDSKCVQLIFSSEKENSQGLRKYDFRLPPESPVAVIGTVMDKRLPKIKTEELALIPDNERVEISVEAMTPLNLFPHDVEVLESTNYSPNQRHLEIRKKPGLKEALTFRGMAASLCRSQLEIQGFLEVETPILFKSTPEGAREFLVPTRRKGFAYALPQSPQQYKQILMASGIPKYYQFAKCFRDEDLRADRQPEFTQIDLEMSFANEHDVMKAIEDLIRTLWLQLLQFQLPENFPIMTYDTVMSVYGSDKPDTRFGMHISQLKSGDQNNSHVLDVVKIPSQLSIEFVQEFLSSIEGKEAFNKEEGIIEIFYNDSNNVSTSVYLTSADDIIRAGIKLKDLVLIYRRKDFLSGGSTAMGRIRTGLYKKALSEGVLPKPKGFSFLWVVDFPLFSPSNDQDPGQSSLSGLSSTHHPFTAPSTEADVDQLSKDPTRVKGAHYDLVVNGVELGGGSRRIHMAELQEYIFRNILKMPDARIDDFKHLLDVLKSGCPPHAGIAIGFDRMVATMLGLDSIRDVIAFPKTNGGEDALVKSPNMLTKEQLQTYHLKLK